MYSVLCKANCAPISSSSFDYIVPGFPNGFHNFPMEPSSCPVACHAPMSSLRHSSIGEDGTHALIIPDGQVSIAYELEY